MKWGRKTFFWLDRLKISKGERRSVAVLLMLLISLMVINALIGPQRPFEQANYTQIKKLFNRRTAMLHRKHETMLAAYQGKSVVHQQDTIPSSTTPTVNINTAGTAKLGKLPGIGPSYAQNIIDYRSTHGPFTTKKELIKVRGIGEARFAKIKPYIELGDIKSADLAHQSPAKSNQKDFAGSTEQQKPTQTGKRINVNTATKKTLVSLPGIGDVYAQHIIQYRRKHGPFTTLQELKKVKGIGKKRLAKLKPFIKLTGDDQ